MGLAKEIRLQKDTAGTLTGMAALSIRKLFK